MFCFILENPMSLPLLSHSLIVFLSTLFVLEVYPLQKSSYLSERKERNLRKRAFVTFFVTHPRTTSYAKFISSLTWCSNKKVDVVYFVTWLQNPTFRDGLTSSFSCAIFWRETARVTNALWKRDERRFRKFRFSLCFVLSFNLRLFLRPLSIHFPRIGVRYPTLILLS